MCSNFKGPAADKLIQLQENFKAVLRDEGLLPSLMQPPCIRRKHATHMFATVLRTQLDRDRNSITTAMTEAFLAACRGGVFEGWRCTVDYSLSKPLNPDVLVGMEVTKLFDGDEHEGKIASYSRARRWWKIHYDDGDREQLNYRELVKLVKPPDLNKSQHETPVSEFESFMRTTGGVPTLKNNNAGAKPGEPEFFTLDSQEWCFITVFLVQDSKMPIQGAYIL